jgi:hypothetical protein
MNQTMKRIEIDPIGLDAKIDEYFYQDNDNQVYLDLEGKRPVLCDECQTQQKVDNEGYFYCPNNCYGDHPLGKRLV